jgi:pteridine reductase
LACGDRSSQRSATGTPSARAAQAAAGSTVARPACPSPWQSTSSVPGGHAQRHEERAHLHGQRRAVGHERHRLARFGPRQVTRDLGAAAHRRDEALHAAYHTLMDLSGKTAVVTGGARRVGRAIVEELARAGARVVVHHSASDAEASALAAALPGAVTVKADLRQIDAPRAVVDAALAATGRLDVLVNNAAGYARTPLDALSDEAWEAMLALNVTAPMRLMRAAVAAGASNLVNIVDIGAWQPWPHYLAYSASKAALLHLTRCLALELAPRVRVNAVAPGTVLFPEGWSPERRARQEARIPLGHAGTPADVARAVRFVIENAHLTGACIPVDGGTSLR